MLQKKRAAVLLRRRKEVEKLPAKKKSSAKKKKKKKKPWTAPRGGNAFPEKTKTKCLDKKIPPKNARLKIAGEKTFPPTGIQRQKPRVQAKGRRKPVGGGEKTGRRGKHCVFSAKKKNKANGNSHCAGERPAPKGKGGGGFLCLQTEERRQIPTGGKKKGCPPPPKKNGGSCLSGFSEKKVQKRTWRVEGGRGPWSFSGKSRFRVFQKAGPGQKGGEQAEIIRKKRNRCPRGEGENGGGKRLSERGVLRTWG